MFEVFASERSGPEVIAVTRSPVLKIYSAIRENALSVRATGTLAILVKNHQTVNPRSAGENCALARKKSCKGKEG